MFDAVAEICHFCPNELQEVYLCVKFCLNDTPHFLKVKPL